MYMPYADEATIDEIGNVTGAQLAAENTKASNLLSALTDTTHGAATPMVILHRHKKDGTIALPYPVTGLVCDPVAATQRRRLRR
jgi:hypothetical protein